MKFTPFIVLALIVVGCATPNNYRSTSDPQYAPFLQITANGGQSEPEEPAIFGTVKNTGNKIVSYLRIKVYFLDQYDNAIAEDSYSILNSESFDSDLNQPLKPNYSLDFGFKVDVSSEWSRKVRAVVEEIETVENQ